MRSAEVEQVARSRRHTSLDPRPERVVPVGTLLLHGVLQRPHERRSPPVVLTVFAIAHPPVVGQPLPPIEPTREHILPELGKPDSADRRHGARETAVHDLGAEAEGFEQLRAGVRAQGADPHLGEDLEQSLLGGGSERGLDVLPRRRAAHRLQGQPRVHRLGAVAEQRGEVVDVARVSRFGDQRHTRAETGLEQPLVHGADGEEHRDRRAVLALVAVADDERRRSPAGIPDRGAANAIERGREPPRSGLGVPHGAEGRDEEPWSTAQRRHLRAEQDGMLEAQQRVLREALREQRTAAPQVHRQRHDPRLAQGIDGGIRDLGEPLAQVSVDARARAREGWNRRVVPHAPDGVGAGRRHGLEYVAQVLEAVAERTLARHEILRRRGGRGIGPDGRQVAGHATRPPLIRIAAGHLALGLSAVEHHVAPRVHHQHLPGAKAAALHDVRGIEVGHADLRAGDHETALRDLVAAGTQAVAVDRGAGDDAVREGESGRTVPRLHQGRVEFVERADDGIELRRALPRLRDEHHERVHRVASRTHQQLECIVEARGIAAAFPNDGLDLLREHGLAGPHRVAVPPQRVDLAVVREQLERLRQRPARHGVGRVALVEDGDRCFEEGRPQVGIERRQLGPGEQRLIDDGAAGERADVQGRDALLRGAAFDRATRDVEAALPAFLVPVPAGGRLDEGLAHGGTAGACEGTQRSGIERHVAPPVHGQAQLSQHLLDQRDRLLERGARWRQEEHAQGKGPGRPAGVQQAARDLGQDAGAVPRVVV